MNRSIVLFIALLPLMAAKAQDKSVALEDAKSIAISVNSGKVTLRSHQGTGVIVRGTRADGTSASSLIAVKREGPVLQFTEVEDAGPLLAATEVLLPNNVPIRFAGAPAQLSITGLTAPLDVLMKHGATEIENHDGSLSINSSAGRISVRNVVGTVRIRGTSESVLVDSLVGVIDAETVAGNIEMKRIQASAANARSQQGSIGFDGVIQSGGSYVFTTLNGDVTWHVPLQGNAAVSFGSVQGTVRSNIDLPMRSGAPGSMQSFVLGNGSAEVKLMTFKGNVVFVRQ